MRFGLQHDGLRAAHQQVVEELAGVVNQRLEGGVGVLVVVGRDGVGPAGLHTDEGGEFRGHAAQEQIGLFSRRFFDAQQVVEQGLVSVENLEQQKVADFSGLGATLR